MNLITYIEHMLTFYDNFFTELDNLYKEAKIVNFAKYSSTRIHGFCLGPEAGVLYLKVIKFFYYKKSDIPELKEMIIPVEKMLLSKNYTFDGGKIVALNNDALKQAVDLVKGEFFSRCDLKNHIQFYIDSKPNVRISIEPNFQGDNEHIKVYRFYGDFNYTNNSFFRMKYLKDNIVFFFKERKFLTDYEDVCFDDFASIEIPPEKLPQTFKKLYENRNFDLVTLTDNDLELHYLGTSEKVLRKI